MYQHHYSIPCFSQKHEMCPQRKCREFLWMLNRIGLQIVRPQNSKIRHSFEEGECLAIRVQVFARICLFDFQGWGSYTRTTLYDDLSGCSNVTFYYDYKILFPSNMKKEHKDGESLKFICSGLNFLQVSMNRLGRL